MDPLRCILDGGARGALVEGGKGAFRFGGPGGGGRFRGGGDGAAFFGGGGGGRALGGGGLPPGGRGGGGGGLVIVCAVAIVFGWSPTGAVFVGRDVTAVVVVLCPQPSQETKLRLLNPNANGQMK